MDLTCGRSEAAVLSRALGRRVVGTLDILSHGPVAGLVARAPEPWVRRRIAYWQRILPGDIDPEWAKGLADDMRRIDAILRARTVRVWMAGTCDGLLLAAWTSHLHHALRTKAVLELVQVRRSPIAPIIAFESISRIPPPAARPITGALQTFLLDLWRAWTAAEPNTLAALQEDAPSRGGMREALGALLDRYPDERTGLTYWESRLLQLVARRGPRLVDVVISALLEKRRAIDRIGDQTIVATLRSMAGRTPNALVTMTTNPERPAIGRIALTSLGERVVAGKASALGKLRRRLWVGGVHLAPGRPLWVRSTDGVRQWRENRA